MQQNQCLSKTIFVDTCFHHVLNQGEGLWNEVIFVDAVINKKIYVLTLHKAVLQSLPITAIEDTVLAKCMNNEDNR